MRCDRAAGALVDEVRNGRQAHQRGAEEGDLCHFDRWLDVGGAGDGRDCGNVDGGRCRLRYAASL